MKKDENSEDIKDYIDRKIGILVEHMDDQFSRVLEGVDTSTSKIPAMSERLEKIESNVANLQITTMNNPHDLKLIKIRTEKFDDIVKDLKDHELRLTKLEANA